MTASPSAGSISPGDPSAAAASPSEGRPLVSYLLFAYRQEEYIAEAMRSALAQTYAPLEIIVSDDASPDRTFTIIERIAAIYDGPHRLCINRNPVNLGMGAHCDRVLKRAEGGILVLAAGDDVSLPERTARVVECFARHPGAGIVYCDLDIIGRDGAFLRRHHFFSDERRINDLDSYLWHDAVVPGAGFAIHRALVDRFGPIHAWNKVEDRLFIFRCRALGRELRRIDLPLVRWRQVGRSAATRRRYACRHKEALQDYAPDEVYCGWLSGSFRQNLVDLWSAGLRAPRIELGLGTRIAELTLASDCWRLDRPGLGCFINAVRAGARPWWAAKLCLKFRYAGAYLALIGPWRRLKRLPRLRPASGTHLRAPDDAAVSARAPR
jgi:glycosyltransferase involved in cell wall biosynthesis